jgi:uncharacterized protein YllA (UPF0747 family)
LGEEQILGPEVLKLAESSPSSFSPNVLLRPVLQDYLLPTLAYVGGAAEIAYFAQLGVLYDKLSGRITPILPRFSATVIEPKPKTLLEKYELGFPDLLQGVEWLSEKIGARLLDPRLQSSFEQAQVAVERSMVAVRESLEQLDKTLVDSAKNAEAKMLHQLSALRSRAARAELRQSEVAERHSRQLSTSRISGQDPSGARTGGGILPGQTWHPTSTLAPRCHQSSLRGSSVSHVVNSAISNVKELCPPPPSTARRGAR